MRGRHSCQPDGTDPSRFVPRFGGRSAGMRQVHAADGRMRRRQAARSRFRGCDGVTKLDEFQNAMNAGFCSSTSWASPVILKTTPFRRGAGWCRRFVPGRRCPDLFRQCRINRPAGRQLPASPPLQQIIFRQRRQPNLAAPAVHVGGVAAGHAGQRNDAHVRLLAGQVGHAKTRHAQFCRRFCLPAVRQRPRQRRLRGFALNRRNARHGGGFSRRRRWRERRAIVLGNG